jgi:8-oxo-dGTP diphosphatase
MARPTHAGAVVYRHSDRGIEILLVRARRDPTLWVLPKGHIEHGEAKEEAALREVREEAGVDGRIVAELGRYSFPKPEGPVLVAMFLAQYRSFVGQSEPREVGWMDFEQARDALAFEDARLILDRASKLIEDLGSESDLGVGGAARAVPWAPCWGGAAALSQAGSPRGGRACRRALERDAAGRIPGKLE